MNLQEIAELAGVNVSTVSRALRDSHAISAQTKEKIMQIAMENGYKVKTHKKKKKIIGIIIPEVVSSYYARLITTLKNEISKKGYACIISVVDFNMNKLAETLQIMSEHGVSSLIIDMSFTYENMISLNYVIYKCKLPLLAIVNENEVNYGCDCVYLNNRLGVQSLVDYLISLGHKRIGYIGDKLSHTRQEEFIHVCKQNALDISPSFILEGTERLERGGYIQMKKLLSLSEIPTAVVASYDQYAIGAMKAIYEKGLRIPEDISIVGFDNITIGDYLPTPLTTVTNPVEKLGEIAVKILIHKLENPTDTTNQHVSLQPNLVIRNTAGVIT